MQQVGDDVLLHHLEPMQRPELFEHDVKGLLVVRISARPLLCRVFKLLGLPLAWPGDLLDEQVPMLHMPSSDVVNRAPMARIIGWQFQNYFVCWVPPLENRPNT
jgi:hypothetical protein